MDGKIEMVTKGAEEEMYGLKANRKELLCYLVVFYEYSLFETYLARKRRSFIFLMLLLRVLRVGVCVFVYLLNASSEDLLSP